MASMRKVLSRPNVLMASTLVLALGSLFYYKYLTEKKTIQRSDTKRRVPSEKESKKEAEEVFETKTTTTTATTTASQPHTSGVLEEETTKSDDGISIQGTPLSGSIMTEQQKPDTMPVVKPTVLTESSETLQGQENTEASTQEVPVARLGNTAAVDEPIALTKPIKPLQDEAAAVNVKEVNSAAMPTHITAEEYSERKKEVKEEEKENDQLPSESESSGSDELMFDTTSSEGITYNNEPASAPPAASSSDTSLDSSASAASNAGESYPEKPIAIKPVSAASRNSTSTSQSKMTGYWQQPNIKTVPQTTNGGWHPLSAKEFKPQIQNNKSMQSRQQQFQQNHRASFYSVEAGNTIATELINPTRKQTKRVVRKQMTREELIQDQWQSHNASFKARCKFWPNCSNRNCKYKHPVKECRWGENCQFGDRCMFLHPRDLAS
ncbi:hypothetical protein BX666DRAFT_904513 [Dichotomocladium elegans]|nr:hypothetical protein BX666DRAFT_904513 [Dichotomocladium elegans]